LSLLILFSKRWVDLGGAAVYAGRWLAQEKKEEVKKLVKRASKGKRKLQKELKTELLEQAIEVTKASEMQFEAPKVALEDLERAIKSFELIRRNIKHIYSEKAVKEFEAELARMKAEHKRLLMLDELENEILTFLLAI
jgi:hypothetical protein